MENCFDITMGNEPVGKATLIKEGLYWKIHCRCQLSGEVVHQVILQAAEEIDLGILVREGGDYCLTKRIAIKRLGDVTPQFTAKPRTPKTERSFHPIVPEEPFSYIEKLKEAFLEEKNGEIGVTLPDQAQVLPTPDSDPTQEYQDESGPE